MRGTVLALLLLAGAARAQGNPPNAVSLAAANRLMAAEGQGASVDQEIAGYRPQMVAMVRTMGITDDKVINHTIDAMAPFLKASRDRYLAAIARAYAAHTSAADLNAMTAFYKTPAGRRIVATHLDVEHDVSVAAKNWLAEAMITLAAQVKAEASKPPVPSAKEGATP
jgi:uncharacterized protein